VYKVELEIDVMHQQTTPAFSYGPSFSEANYELILSIGRVACGKTPSDTLFAGVCGGVYTCARARVCVCLFPEKAGGVKEAIEYKRIS
jgi:hypothetical protein